MALQLHTRNLTAGQEFEIGPDEEVTQLTYQMSTATGDNATLLGSSAFRAANDSTAQDSVPVVIPAGGGNTFISDDAKNQPIQLKLTCVQGTLKIIVQR